MALFLTSPVPGAPIARFFGWSLGVFHAGVDYRVPVGTPVRAAAAGQVIRAGYAGARGLRVVIQHDGGVLTTYEHNHSLQVAPGQEVSAGQLIAFSGVTGKARWSHLHFGVVSNGRLVNPQHALSLGINTETGELYQYKFMRGVAHYAALAVPGLAALLFLKGGKQK
jgi:murein DD-endopeptidase MepM/ murein hydrolase activator NlpD